MTSPDEPRQGPRHAPQPTPAVPLGGDAAPTRRRGWLPWGLVVLVVLLAVSAGVVWAVRRDRPAADPATPPAGQPTAAPTVTDFPDTAPTPDSEAEADTGTPEPSPTAGTRAPATANPAQVVLEVLGAGRATVSVQRTDAADRQFRNAALPFRFAFVPGQARVGVRLEAVRGRGAARLSCRISRGGVALVERTVAGGNARAVCGEVIVR